MPGRGPHGATLAAHPDDEERPLARRKPLSLALYLETTRRRSFSAVVVIALLAIYEIAVLAGGNTYRNAADVLLKGWLAALGPHGSTIFHVFLLGLFLFGAGRAARRDKGWGRCFFPFLVESTMWACLLAPTVFWLEKPFLMPGGFSTLVLDIGAGVYEEIVFRFLLVGGVLLLLEVDPWRTLHGDRKESVAQAILPVALVMTFGSALFAGYHHVGPGGDPFEWNVFAFRFLAGMLLSGLYIARGLGVAVYTHAFYDVLVHITR